MDHSPGFLKIVAALKAGIVEILGDDEDAMVDAMEDCGV